jgi:transposase
MGISGNRLGKAFRISNDCKGFHENFPKMLEKLNIKHIKPSQVVIAFECSMNYWKTFAYHCVNLGYFVVLTNPLKTRHGRPLLDGTFSKSDAKDAHVIAEIALSGKFNICPTLKNHERPSQSLYRRSHELSIYYHKLDKDITAYKQRLSSILNIIFPEFSKCLDPYCQTGLYLLEHYHIPESYIAMDIKKELRNVKKTSRGKVTLKKLKQIQEAACTSIGVKDDDVKLERSYIVKDCITGIRNLESRKEVVIEKIKSLVSQTPWYKIICSIKGIGEISAALFIAEFGDLSRFTHYKQMEKFAGLNLRLCDSGEFYGQRKVSKMGNKRLRCIIYNICDNMRRHDPMVKRKFLKRRIKHKGKYFTKDILSLSSICLRIIMSLVKQRKLYDIERVHCPQLDYLEHDYEVMEKKAA